LANACLISAAKMSVTGRLTTEGAGGTIGPELSGWLEPDRVVVFISAEIPSSEAFFRGRFLFIRLALSHIKFC
jgi:hypothetical protein